MHCNISNCIYKITMHYIFDAHQRSVFPLLRAPADIFPSARAMRQMISYDQLWVRRDQGNISVHRPAREIQWLAKKQNNIYTSRSLFTLTASN